MSYVAWSLATHSPEGSWVKPGYGSAAVGWANAAAADWPDEDELDEGRGADEIEGAEEMPSDGLDEVEEEEEGVGAEVTEPAESGKGGQLPSKLGGMWERRTH